MKDTQKHDRTPHSLASYVVSCLLLLWITSCTGINNREYVKQFSRVGESVIISDSRDAITNAIVLWSRTLTNGYVLYGDTDTRLYHTSLKTDPATFFMLRNGTNAAGIWGKSACLPPGKSSYWADIIIRVLPISNSNKVSVAICGLHSVPGLLWNFDTYSFEHEKIKLLPPCPQDERQVLDEILSTLRKKPLGS
jgi:hypothetical protein